MARLSDVFKHISHFRHGGHQVGRKVGDMLEVLTYSALSNVPKIKSRLAIEPKLHGFCDAGHKVEFAIMKKSSDSYRKSDLAQIKNPKEIVCFVECKKVGVEQTVNQSFKKQFSKNGDGFDVPLGSSIRIPLGSMVRGSGANGFSFSFEERKAAVNLTVVQDGVEIWSKQVSRGERYIFCLEENGQKHFINNEGSLRDVKTGITACKILEVIDVESEVVNCILNDCLPGPQTPEKAKQSSFVALDVRKLQTNSFDKRPNENEYKSILVITEASHWEEKSRNMVRACVDINLTVDDEVLVEAFVAFETEFGSSFYPQISKENYRINEKVKKISDEILDRFDQKIFRDLDTGRLLKFSWENDQVQLSA